MNNKQKGFGAAAAIVISTVFLALTSATCYAETATATKKVAETNTVAAPNTKKTAATPSANSSVDKTNTVNTAAADKTTTGNTTTDKTIDDQLALVDTDSTSDEVASNKDPL